MAHEPLLDDEDKDLLDMLVWYPNSGYLRAYIKGSGRKATKTVYLHQLVGGRMGLRHVDHINRNRMDNRRVNLREASFTENIRNRGLNRNNTTGYIGVNLHKKRFRAYINKGAKQVYIGSFKTAKEAAVARDKVAIELFGEFAVLNESLYAA